MSKPINQRRADEAQRRKHSLAERRKLSGTDTSPPPWQDEAISPDFVYYDPAMAPDSEEWLSLDEEERLFAIEHFHMRARIDLPNGKIHAFAHTVIENQIALGDPSVTSLTLNRLIAEGLDRHESNHALGAIFVDLIVKLTSGQILV